jgi:hypothetical protein
MAENTALALLSNQQQQSAQVFGQIMGAMNSVQQTAQQTAQFTFAVAAKEAQMREEARMNDARIATLGFQNDLAAKQHNAKMELLPYEVENERLKIEAYKANAKTALLKTQNELFSSSIDPFNKVAAARFTEIQDPAYMEGYIALTTKHKGLITAGGSYDPNSFKVEFDELNRQFQDAEAKSGYNPQTSFYLGAIGEKDARDEYENSRNPDRASSLTATRTSLITGDGTAFGKLTKGEAKKLGLSEEEIANLSTINQNYKQLDASIKSQFEIVERADTALKMAQASGGNVAFYEDSLKVAQERLGDFQKQQRDIYQAGIKGISAPSLDPQPKPRQIREDEAREAAVVAAEEVKPKAVAFGRPDAGVIGAARDKIPETLALFGGPARESKGGGDIVKDTVGTITFQDIKPGWKDHWPTKKDIRKRVLSNLESNDVKDMELLFTRKESSIRKFFEDRKGKPLTLSSRYGSQTSYGYGASVNNYGGTKTPEPEIKNYEELRGFLEKRSGMSETERELILKDLYADIVLNGLMDAY